MTSETKLGPGAVETAVPDGSLAELDNDGAVAPVGFGDGDGGWTPPTAKVYSEFLDITFGTGFAAQKGLAQGCFCFGREHLLTHKPRTPLTCVILSATPYWREEKTYDPNAKAREFKTEAEANAAGLRTVRTPKGSGLPMPDCRPAAAFELLVQAPEEPTTSLAFTLLFDGKRYAPARFRVPGSQFATIEKMLSQLPGMDAAVRGRPPAEGSLRAFFVTFTIDPEVDPKTGRTRTRLWLNPVVDKATGKPVRVPENFWKEVREYQAQLKAVQALPAASGDEPPSVLDDPEGQV